MGGGGLVFTEENAEVEGIGLMFFGGRGTEPKKEVMEGCCLDESDPGSVLLKTLEAKIDFASVGMSTLSEVGLLEPNIFVAAALLKATVGGGLFIRCVEDPKGPDSGVAAADPNGLEAPALEEDAPNKFEVLAKGFTTPGKSPVS